ncbi:hypothetical protein DF185_19775 [Marinifilum breve]|uniref:Uncharacterized protein n=1 Tax=Marinifilum breve TaxID=2184082 RepID=A0A2V3ZRQ8_9BACT|nr:hypothetical protein [Marinifilum breve]PXX96881.1 hypothetical protein DF185_19775 [Marinifilum breve]
MYVDKSDNEYSIHQLDEVDLKIIFEAVSSELNQLSFSDKNDHLERKQRIVRIKKSIKNELHDI